MSESRDQFDYVGKELTATWDRRLCIHVGECTRAKGAIFKSGRTPWGDPDRADPATVAEVVARCPTGALTVRHHDGAPTEAAPAQNTMAVSNCGPLVAYGDLHIEGAPDDMPGVRFRAALCRCGQSANKPFCDNSHEGVDFRDHGPIGSTGEPLQDHGGPLAIRPLEDGPLLVEGNLTLVSGHGRATWTGRKVALCRCGASANKPFCDGSHEIVGFSSSSEGTS